jgi:hypothetical protein
MLGTSQGTPLNARESNEFGTPSVMLVAMNNQKAFYGPILAPNKQQAIHWFPHLQA